MPLPVAACETCQWIFSLFGGLDFIYIEFHKSMLGVAPFQKQSPQGLFHFATDTGRGPHAKSMFFDPISDQSLGIAWFFSITRVWTKISMTAKHPARSPFFWLGKSCCMIAPIFPRVIEMKSNSLSWESKSTDPFPMPTPPPTKKGLIKALLRGWWFWGCFNTPLEHTPKPLPTGLYKGFFS